MLSVARLEQTKQVPRFRSKVDAVCVMASFDNKAATIIRNVKCIAKASAAIVSSHRLARCLEYLLAIGNLMNHGENEHSDHSGRKLYSRGFTIDSLLKLASARSTNSGKKFTLLDFYVSMVVNREEEDLLLLGTDLIGLDAASRLSNAQVTERISVHLCTCLYACIWGCVLIRLNLCSGIVGWGAA